jgi:hypothetical protein
MACRKIRRRDSHAQRSETCRKGREAVKAKYEALQQLSEIGCWPGVSLKPEAADTAELIARAVAHLRCFRMPCASNA